MSRWQHPRRMRGGSRGCACATPPHSNPPPLLPPLLATVGAAPWLWPAACRCMPLPELVLPAAGVARPMVVVMWACMMHEGRVSVAVK